MTRPARPFVRVLQHVAPEGPGRIAQSLGKAGIDVEVTRIDLGEAVPTGLEGASGLVVMGGPMGVYEAGAYPHLRDEARLIEAALRDRAPVVGVCLGSQLLASALGARVYAGGRKEIGWFSIVLGAAAVDDPLLSAAPATFGALHWHGDVFDLPGGAVSLARSELTEHQAFRFGDRAYGFLFHLEADTEHVRNMTTTFADELAAEGLDGDAIVRSAREHERETGAIADSVFGAFARLITGDH